jgi:wyosine [tRNA(Phe)-imidazoG37] synthetase (radical SAM superfamily)
MAVEKDLKSVRAIELSEVCSVYGPVRSWRVGMSLGIDLLCTNSICSFNCTYCQLGSIQVRTNRRQVFVPTEKVMTDFKASRWRESDVVTLSGSGEPTLAANMGEVIGKIRDYSNKPTLVLTNGTQIHRPEVRRELVLSDRVYIKLDAATDEVFRRVNRPVSGVSLSRIVEGAVQFRSEYEGYLGIQMMFVHSNRGELERFAGILNRIRPDEVQVNSPTRPYPDGWYLDSRGSHEGVDYPAKPLKPLTVEEISKIVEDLKDLTGGFKIISVFRG